MPLDDAGEDRVARHELVDGDEQQLCVERLDDGGWRRVVRGGDDRHRPTLTRPASLSLQRFDVRYAHASERGHDDRRTANGRRGSNDSAA